jgi:hypothetical protein
MFIRFVVHKLDPDSGRRQGIFQAAAVLRDSDQLSASDISALDDLAEWFSKNLEKPTHLDISTRPHGKAQAISWFKSSATQHIGKMREFQLILEHYDIAVDVLKTKRPGYVVYDDKFQIAAYPFSDTPT